MAAVATQQQRHAAFLRKYIGQGIIRLNSPRALPTVYHVLTCTVGTEPVLSLEQQPMIYARQHILCLVGLPTLLGQCPNMCSGHGNCGPENVCSCFEGFDYAPDCSLRFFAA